jgi:hypothetical protein
MPTTKRYSPYDLKKWLTKEDFKKRERWKNGNNKMKERKPDVDRKEDEKGMPKKEKVTRLRTGYMRATHRPKMERLAIHFAPSATPIYP